MKRIVVEVPEPAGRTESEARQFVVAALVKVLDDRTEHERVLYWAERVKVFDRVFNATVERPLDVDLVRRLAAILSAVSRGDVVTASVYVREAGRLLEKMVEEAGI